MSVQKIGDWGFDKLDQAFKQLKENDLPLLIGKTAQNHFVEGFRKGGGQTDASLSGWVQRKTKNKSDRRNPNKNRAILVESSHLMRSVRLLEYTFQRILIGTRGIIYAERHNEGIDMPKREFIGKSAKLNEKIISLITKQMDLIFKK